jgi:hypothetical protein
MILVPQENINFSLDKWNFHNKNFIDHAHLFSDTDENDKEITDKNFLLLSYHEHPVIACRAVVFGISGADQFDKIMEDSSYECYVNKYKHHALYPVAIISNDLSKYDELFLNSGYLKTMAKDKEWNLQFHCSSDTVHSYHKTIFQKIKQGSGYSGCYRINDGSPFNRLLKAKLSNGDFILFDFLYWANK